MIGNDDTIATAETRLDTLAEHLAQALRQWRMYAESEEDRDLTTEKTAEGEMYRASVAAHQSACSYSPATTNDTIALADKVERASDAFWYWIPKADRDLIVTALRAYSPDMSPTPKIIDNGQNPLLTVSADDVLAWLRSIADRAGYADRETCAVQLSVTQGFVGDLTFHHECPTLTIMVSNIPNSRALPSG